jgi:hypothetical protein
MSRAYNLAGDKYTNNSLHRQYIHISYIFRLRCVLGWCLYRINDHLFSIRISNERMWNVTQNNPTSLLYKNTDSPSSFCSLINSRSLSFVDSKLSFSCVKILVLSTNSSYIFAYKACSHYNSVSWYGFCLNHPAIILASSPCDGEARSNLEPRRAAIGWCSHVAWRVHLSNQHTFRVFNIAEIHTDTATD